MAESTKLEPLFVKINSKILKEWKESFTHEETIRNQIEEALTYITIKNKEKLIKKLNGR